MVKIKDIITNLGDYKGKKDTIKGYISNVELAETRLGGKYLKFNINDETGTIGGKIWDEARSKKLHEYLKENELNAACATFECTIKDYQGQADIAVDSLKLHVEQEIKQYFEKSLIDVEEYCNKVRNLISLVNDEDYKKLLEVSLLFGDYVERFTNWPAATFNHHNYVHGLLEHTVNVVELSISIAKANEKIYPVDYDLLITGGLLHDIGKLYEYELTDGVGYSEEGEFIYHTVSGPMLLHELNITKELNIPREKLMKVIHLLSSHHGEYAEHTPNAQCFEAHILSFADNTDAKVNGIARAFAVGKQKKMQRRL